MLYSIHSLEYSIHSLEYPWTSATRQLFWYSYPHILHKTVAQYPKWISAVDGREDDCLKSKEDLCTEIYREFTFVCTTWIGCIPGKLSLGFHSHVKHIWRQQGTKELWRVDYTACARSCHVSVRVHVRVQESREDPDGEEFCFTRPKLSTKMY